MENSKTGPKKAADLLNTIQIKNFYTKKRKAG
jgi:hypothetical protein